jgi:GNAT superfamily N-acetyltransferase
MVATIRAARPEDAPLLREVERDAGERFRTVGLPAIADNEPASEDFIASICRHGVALCAVDAADTPVGLLLAGRLDGALHIYELSVATAWGRQGIGHRLVEAVAYEARRRGIAALTLATFRDVPWNRPFYERLGFAEVQPAVWTPAFHVLHAAEQLSGLPIERRLFMRKELS